MQVALRLNDLENMYRKGSAYELAGFLLQGKALWHINDGNKWVESGAKSFKNYCEEVLGVGKSLAYDKAKIWKEHNDFFEAHQELNFLPPTRIVRLIPYLTPENREELLNMAAHVPSAKDFDNNIRNLAGKQGTDECEHDFTEVVFHQCNKCGLKVKDGE